MSKCDITEVTVILVAIPAAWKTPKNCVLCLQIAPNSRAGTRNDASIEMERASNPSGQPNHPSRWLLVEINEEYS